MTRDWSATFYRLATFLLVLALSYAGLTAIDYLHDVLSIVISAMLISYVLQMAVEPLSRRMPRLLAVGLVVVGFIVAITAGVLLTVPLVTKQLQMLVGQLPTYFESLQLQLNVISDHLASRKIHADFRVDSWVLPRLETMGQGIAGNLPSLLMGSFSGLFTGAMIFVCAFYFLKDGMRMWRVLADLLPARAAVQIEYLRVELDLSLNRYLRGQLINAGLVMISASTAFTVLGMTYGIVAGLIWGVAEIIPYFGLYIGLGTALLLAGIQGGAVIGKVLLAGLIIWWTKDNIIAPRVMSHATGLHPIIIIMAVLTGGKVAGFLGVLLAIPVTAVLVTTLRFWLVQQRSRDGLAPVPEPIPAPAMPEGAPPSPLT